MAISDRIEAIEQHLTDDYNVLEVAGADLTNVDKNILNLKTTWQERLLYFMNNGTDVVWNNWDKVTGEGTSISLNNTLEGKMKIYLKGNTSQESTTGKNLFDISKVLSNGTRVVNNGDGTLTVQAYGGSGGSPASLKTYCPNLQVGDNVILTFETTSTNKFIYLSGTNQIWRGGVERTITQSDLDSSVLWYSNDNSTTATISDIMISISGGDYEQYTGGNPAPNPDYPQDIHVVSGDNTINVCGKNLFDIDSSLDGKYYESDGTIHTSTNAFGELIPISSTSMSYTIKNNSTTNVRDYLFIFDENMNRISGPRWGSTVNAGATVTLENLSTTNAKYITISVLGLSPSSKEQIKIQLEKGSNATTYEAYKGTSYPISLGVENLFDFSNTTISTLGTVGTTTVEDNKVIFTANGRVYGIQFDIKNLVKKNTTYTISNLMSSTQILTGISTGWRYYDGSSYTNLGGYQTQFTFTTGTGTTHILYYYIGAPIQYNGTLTLSNIQLEKGTKANSYSEYGTTPIELCKIGDYQDSIKKSTGRNIWNEQWENGYYNRTTGAKGSGNTYIRSADYIPVEPNSTIYFNKPSEFANYAVIFYDSTKTITGTIPAPTRTLSAPIEVPSTAKYFTFYGDTGVANATYKNNVMISLGTTALPYEPYGTGWYVKKEIGKVVLDGSETGWAYSSTNTNFNIRPYSLGMRSNNMFTGYIPKVCSHFKYFASNGNQPNLADGIYENVSTSNISFLLFHCDSLNITTLESWQTWLSTNKPIIYYVLETPTYTLIEDSTLIEELESMKKSYENQTNISQENNDLASILNATALSE